MKRKRGVGACTAARDQPNITFPKFTEQDTVLILDTTIFSPFNDYPPRQLQSYVACAKILLTKHITEGLRLTSKACCQVTSPRGHKLMHFIVRHNKATPHQPN